MAWIESHQEIGKHPKTLMLASLMGWSVREAVGALHLFWHWCVDYAEDGDLRRYNDAVLASAVGLNSDAGKRFVEAMVTCGGEVESGFIDRDPYFRVHDWWDYFGPFLKVRYKHKPMKWKRIRRLYQNSSNNSLRTEKAVRLGQVLNLKKRKGVWGEGTVLPDWLPADLWQQFRLHREKLKDPLTAYAEERAIAKLGRLRGEGNDVREVIQQSIDGPWKGLFAVKKQRGKATGGAIFRALAEPLPD